MKESMIFPREEKTEILFQKIHGPAKNFRKPSAIRVYVAKKQMRYFRRINFQKLYLRLIKIVISRHS